MKKLILPAILLSCLSHALNGQMRQLFQSPETNNYLKKYSFYSPREGYSSFSFWLGHTQDTGHTYTKKYITLNNVDFGTHSVNITFGFMNNGCVAFNKDTVVVYGNYGLIPAILYSVDQGNSFKLVFHTPKNSTELNLGILDMVFPQKTKTGYAIDYDRILKTTNKGLTWTPIYIGNNISFTKLFFLDDFTGYAVSDYKVLKTTNGGVSWQEINLPAPGQPVGGLFFLSENKGYIYQNSQIYYTLSGGSSWEQRTNEYSGSYSSSIYFIDDTTGYSAGDTIYVVHKTTDGGRTWENCERNNNYSYEAYTFSELHFWNANQFWARGDFSSYSELTTNGGGKTLPRAFYTIDLSQLNSTNTISLVNHSKTGYTYKWIKNKTQFSTSYSTSYITPRTGIDTLQLVVSNSVYSDTVTKIIDTRPAQPACNGDFTFVRDTSVVKFTASQTAGVLKHYWYFGDGVIDSINVNPIHTYAAAANYQVKHIVKNTISNCKDSVIKTVTVIRTHSCYTPNFTFVADPFYTNQLVFTPSIPDNENVGGFGGRGRWIWNFDDGVIDSVSATANHAFDSSRFYNVSLTLRNTTTGCVGKIVKPVFVQMDSNCNAGFKIHPVEDSIGIVLNKFTNIRFTGKPANRKTGRRNSWTIDGWQTTVTGNSNQFSKQFYTVNAVFGTIWNNVGCLYSKEYNLDSSLTRTIKHTTYDSVTNCVDTMVRTFTIPTITKVTIRYSPDPLFPQFVSIKAFKYNNSPTQDTTAYSGAWVIGSNGIGTPGSGNGTSGFNFFIKNNTGLVNIAVISPICDGGHLQYYYIQRRVNPIGPCDIYPPRFTATASPAQPNTFTFGIPYPIDFVNNIEMEYRRVWYFGNGDSSTAVSPVYTFTSGGPQNVTLKYIAPAGCSKDTTITVIAGQPCNLTANFTFTRQAGAANIIQFNNQTVTDTGTISYKWYFGNGDSSTAKNPSFTYTLPGTYNIRLKASRSNGCSSEMAQPIQVTAADICTLTPSFTFIIDSAAGNKVSFTNTSTPVVSDTKYTWDFGDGTSDSTKNAIHVFPAIDDYKVCLTVRKSGLCIKSTCDTVAITSVDGGRASVFSNPVTNNQLIISVISNQNRTAGYSIYNQSGSVVMQGFITLLQGTNQVKLNVASLPRGLYIIHFENNGILQKLKFLKL